MKVCFSLLWRYSSIWRNQKFPLHILSVMLLTSKLAVLYAFFLKFDTVWVCELGTFSSWFFKTEKLVFVIESFSRSILSLARCPCGGRVPLLKTCCFGSNSVCFYDCFQMRSFLTLCQNLNFLSLSVILASLVCVQKEWMLFDKRFSFTTIKAELIGRMSIFSVPIMQVFVRNVDAG